MISVSSAHAAAGVSWPDAAMLVCSVISAILFGLLSAVTVYLALADRLRRTLMRDARTATREIQNEISESLAALEREGHAHLEATEQGLLVIRAILQRGTPAAAGGARNQAAAAQASTQLERALRRLRVLQGTAELKDFWWFAEHGEGADLEALRDYVSCATRGTSEVRTAAVEAIRRIEGRKRK